MIDIESALRVLTVGGVEFIVVRGVAARGARLRPAHERPGRPLPEAIAELEALFEERQRGDET